MSSKEYVSVNRLASTVAQNHPSSLYIFVYFDKYYSSDFNRVNIIPLKIVAVNDKKEFTPLDDLFPDIRYVCAPNFVMKNLKPKDAFYKLVIEVKETKNKNEEFNYHKIKVYSIFNAKLHEKLNPYRVSFGKDIVDLDIDPDMF